MVTPKYEDQRGWVSKWLRTQNTLALNQLTYKTASSWSWASSQPMNGGFLLDKMRFVIKPWAMRITGELLEW